MMIFVSFFLSVCLSFLPISVALSKRMRRLFNEFAWSRKSKRVRRCQRVCVVPASEDVFSWQNKYAHQPGCNASSINLANLLHCLKITHLLAGKKKKTTCEHDLRSWYRVRWMSGGSWVADVRSRQAGWPFMNFGRALSTKQMPFTGLRRDSQLLWVVTVPAEMHYWGPAAHDWGVLPDPLQPWWCFHPGIRCIRSSAREHGYSFVGWWPKDVLLPQLVPFFLCKFQTGTMASIHDLVEIIRNKRKGRLCVCGPALNLMVSILAEHVICYPMLQCC